jgi:two-component system, NtrC family, sensor kinase
MNGPADLRETDPTQWALRERVKELTCLYGIAQVANHPGLTLDEALAHVASLLPPAWQYPEVTSGRLTLDGREYCSEPFAPGPFVQAAEITVAGAVRGEVEVFYREPCPVADEGPFLKEERSLINEVARQVGLLGERREAVAERARLQEQLWHADRLATIGQLAAGVAHELNEPLGAILGYAQLALKSFGLPDQIGRDMEKIVKASLAAREIVRKLLIFARQVPTEKRLVQLNTVVCEALSLLEVRCIRSGVKMSLKLEESLPGIFADAGQLQQVVLNLAVNALQSMSAGGILTVLTAHEDGCVLLSVRDTGHGVSADVLRRVFNPFFTTKEVGQGTGLGLSVVHGIVTAHGGTVSAASEEGKGSSFDVLLPAGTNAGRD